MKPTLLAAFAVTTAAANISAQAGVLTNGDFELGTLAGWTQFALNGGTFGSDYPQVTQFDTENDGTPSFAATFKIGGPGFPIEGGGGLLQNITLPDGDYDLSVSIGATLSSSVSNPNGDAGNFSLLFDGNVISTTSLGPINPGEQKSVLLSGSLSGVVAGTHEIQIQITRLFLSTVNAPTQYVDNVQISGESIPEPGAAVLITLGAITLARFVRRR